jgi:TonB-dependent SusC/RagA subfamily outer membrane receptor
LGSVVGVILALLVAVPVEAQTGTIQGLVTDQVTGTRVVGAQVSVLGTDTQTRTRVDGTYVLPNMPIGRYRVQVLIVGYSSVVGETNVVAGDPVTLDFELTRLTIEMDAVVVTGTPGETKRRAIGNAISSVTTQELERAPIYTLNEALAGQATGTIVLNNSGQVGTGSTIRLRGNSSIQMSQVPLIYVDGVRIENEPMPSSDEAGQAASALNNINPDDIESIEIVKGAAATTLYGTEASAGVIQIITKKGTAGRASWSFSMDQGWHQLGHVGPPKDINPDGLHLNDCTESDTLGCPASGTYLRKGHIQRYNLSVRGGSEQTNYFLSGKWASENGVIAPQGSDDWSVRGNFGFQPSGDLAIQYNNSYTHRDINWIPDGDNREGFLLNVYRGYAGYTPGDNDMLILDMRLDQVIDNFITGVQTVWTPLPSLPQRLSLGLDWNRSEYTEEKPFEYWGEPPGARENDTYTTQNITVDYSGTWEANVSSSWTSTFSWGGQLYDEKRRRINGFGEEFGGPGDKDLDAAARTTSSETRIDITSGGFFAQEMIGWNDRLFLTGGIRWDGFSTFGDDFGLAMYPKVSLSYVLSDHDFWPVWFETLKLRGAVGYSGRAPGVFDSERTWDAVSGDDGLPAVTPANVGDPGLGPEKTREIEVGAEGVLFGGRLAFDYTYYRQNTFDALVGVQQVPSLGFVGSQLQNVGELANQGHEVSLDLVLINQRAFNWDLGFRYGNNSSEALDIGEEIIIVHSTALTHIREGFPVPGIFGQRVIDSTAVGDDALERCDIPENWDEWQGYLDGDPEHATDCGYLGPAYPTFSYGINTTFTIGRRLTIDALGEALGGHYMTSGTARQNTRRGEWPYCEDLSLSDGETGLRDRVLAGDVDDITALWQAKCASNPRYEDWATRADFFRVRHITVSYRLPESWLPQFRNITLRASVKNPYLNADFFGIDPEAVDRGSYAGRVGRREYYNMPNPTTFVFTIRTDF